MDINSWHFLAFSAVAVVLCRLAGPSALRNIVLLCMNVYFMALFVNDLRSALYLVAVLGTIYVFGRWKVHRGADWSGPTQLAIVAGLWIVLFLTKDPRLLAPLNPFLQHPVKIIGLSYLMFRGISYVMEVDLSRNTSIATYLNYMLFFPMVLAGPIERYNEFQKQTFSQVEGRGIALPAMHRIVNGFFKKFVLADNLSAFGILSVGAVPDASPALLWLGALSQLFIIFLDFSGYCDIVIGLAMLMGFRLRENFDHPFRSRNVKEFWERWHISLGQMIRDYVFNPLAKLTVRHVPGPNQFAFISLTYCFAMVLVALWHGTTLGFLIFGLVHACALLIHQMLDQAKRRRKTAAAPPTRERQVLVNGLSAAMTYSFVSVSLILWTSTDLRSLNVFARMLGLAP